MQLAGSLVGAASVSSPLAGYGSLGGERSRTGKTRDGRDSRVAGQPGTPGEERVCSSVCRIGPASEQL